MFGFLEADDLFYQPFGPSIQLKDMMGVNSPKQPAGRRVDEDRPLVERAQEGDSQALGELFSRHAPMVRRLLAGLVGVEADLDDLVQDVFLQVHRSVHGFRGDSRFSTWLHQLTVYAGYNYLRKPRKRHIPVDPSTLSTTIDNRSASAYDRLLGRETLRRLYDVLDKIKPKKRIAFILYAVHGMSASEVAEYVGASMPTVKSRIWFARRELLRKARQDAYLSALLEELDCNESST